MKFLTQLRWDPSPLLLRAPPLAPILAPTPLFPTNAICHPAIRVCQGPLPPDFPWETGFVSVTPKPAGGFYGEMG